MVYISDIARTLQELSDEEVDNCRELESDSDVGNENIDYDNFDSDSEQNVADDEVEIKRSLESTF